MGTRVTLAISIKEQPEGSGAIDLENDFDSAMNKWQPVNPAASALEHRENMTYTKTDGKRVMLNPGVIAILEEIDES